MNCELNYWRAQYVLEGLKMLQDSWLTIVRATDDADIQSDYSNDLAQLQTFIENLEERAVEEFGKNVADFSRETYAERTSKA